VKQISSSLSGCAVRPATLYVKCYNGAADLAQDDEASGAVTGASRVADCLSRALKERVADIAAG
jgi:hypothetical protein